MPRKTWEFRWIVHSLVDLGWCVWTAFKLRDVLLELIGVSHMDPFEVGLPELPKFSVKPHLANHPQRLPNFNPNGKFNPLGLKSSGLKQAPRKRKNKWVLATFQLRVSAIFIGHREQHPFRPLNATNLTQDVHLLLVGQFIQIICIQTICLSRAGTRGSGYGCSTWRSTQVVRRLFLRSTWRCEQLKLIRFRFELWGTTNMFERYILLNYWYILWGLHFWVKQYHVPCSHSLNVPPGGRREVSPAAGAVGVRTASCGSGAAGAGATICFGGGGPPPRRAGAGGTPKDMILTHSQLKLWGRKWLMAIGLLCNDFHLTLISNLLYLKWNVASIMGETCLRHLIIHPICSGFFPFLATDLNCFFRFVGNSEPTHPRFQV